MDGTHKENVQISDVYIYLRFEFRTQLSALWSQPNAEWR